MANNLRSLICFLILTSLLPHSLQLVLLPVFIRSCDLHPVIGGSLLPSLLTPPSATVLSASSLIAVHASACDWSGNVDQPVNNPVIITVVIEPFASSYDPALILDVCLLSWVGQQPLFSFFFFHKRFGGGGLSELINNFNFTATIRPLYVTSLFLFTSLIIYSS